MTSTGKYAGTAQLLQLVALHDARQWTTVFLLTNIYLKINKYCNTCIAHS